MAAVSMVMMPVACAARKEATCLKPLLPSKLSKAGVAGGGKVSGGKLVVRASMKKKLAAGVTTGLIAASSLAPMAEAATGISPSLKNFLLSIAAGGGVLLLLIGAVIGVATFDPVKRI